MDWWAVSNVLVDGFYCWQKAGTGWRRVRERIGEGVALILSLCHEKEKVVGISRIHLAVNAAASQNHKSPVAFFTVQPTSRSVPEQRTQPRLQEIRCLAI